MPGMKKPGDEKQGMKVKDEMSGDEVSRSHTDIYCIILLISHSFMDAYVGKRVDYCTYFQ